MLKIKITAVLGILFFVGIILTNSPSFSSAAKGDVFEEIAGYKTWTKITREPLRVEIDDFSGG